MAPPQFTPKALTKPARDTASDLDLPLWRRKPASNELYDFAKCLETERPKDSDPVNHNSTNTLNTLDSQN
eukprot:5843465-Pleurochrysis_carterae.AAC.1